MTIRDNSFDYLSGCVSVNRDAPDEWKTEAVLPFWYSPNAPEFGEQLSRILYHETIHFWQLMYSPYLLRTVGKMWEQLLRFESAGELVTEKDSMNEVREQLFSVNELVECWARYWDVHARGATRIIKEEGIVIEQSGVDVTDKVMLEYKDNYTSIAFDAVMTLGPESRLYARPYRWLLHHTDGNSLLANILFPLITNASFTTQNPVKFFYKAMEIALTSKRLVGILNQYQNSSINMTWLQCWDTVAREVIILFTDPAKTGDKDLEI